MLICGNCGLTSASNAEFSVFNMLAVFWETFSFGFAMNFPGVGQDILKFNMFYNVLRYFTIYSVRDHFFIP